MSRNVSINSYFRAFREVLFVPFVLFQTFSGLQIMKIWSVNYGLHFGSIKIPSIAYIGDIEVSLALT